jgi:DHA1 family inner membrane transport protein
MRDELLVNSASDRRLLILGCLLFVSGSAIFYMFPAYLAQMAGRLSLDFEQLGTLAAVECLAIGVTSLLGPIWIARLSHRLCAILGILVCVLGNIATAHCESFHAVLLSRLVTGLLGEGVLLTLSYSVIGAVRNVDRGFAIALTTAVSFGAAVIAAAAVLQRHFESFGTLLPLLVVALATLPCVAWLSLEPAPATAIEANAESAFGDRRVLFALLAQAIWFAAPGAFWTFAEQVAVNKGIASDSAELALSIGELASLAGSLLAAAQGERWGRRRPIIVATVGIVVTAYWYLFSATPLELALVLSLFYIFWNYGTVYQMGFVSSLDTTGRFAVVMPAAQVIGLSIGPYVAGRWMEKSGDSAVVLATAVFAALGVALYLIPRYSATPARPTQSRAT